MGNNTKSTKRGKSTRTAKLTKAAPPVRRGALKREGGEDRFPPGIEGTRGEKDSAWQAQKWREDQRSYPGAEPGSGPAGRAGALGDTYDAATQRMAQQLPYQLERPEPGRAAAAEFAAQTVGGISISGVRTASQAGNQSVFLLNSDALALVIDVTATAALVGSGRLFDANFQIIEFATNNVRVSQPTNNIAFNLGQFFWISRGNNWGPTQGDYTTPAEWGLSAGLYLFRATVAVQGIQDFAVSNDLVFRVR